MHVYFIFVVLEHEFIKNHYKSGCTSPKHPVSSIEPGLAIHFTYVNTHVSMPFSQIISPFPSPTESKRLTLLLKT